MFSFASMGKGHHHALSLGGGYYDSNDNPTGSASGNDDKDQGGPPKDVDIGNQDLDMGNQMDQDDLNQGGNHNNGVMNVNDGMGDRQDNETGPLSANQSQMPAEMAMADSIADGNAMNGTGSQEQIPETRNDMGAMGNGNDMDNGNNINNMDMMDGGGSNGDNGSGGGGP